MKTRINQLVVAALFALIMLVGNVSAKGTEINASSHENIVESSLEMEDWMVNENCWNSAEDAFYFFEIEDESFALESWMTDVNTWIFSSLEYLETETDQELSFESWMIKKNVWNR